MEEAFFETQGLESSNPGTQNGQRQEREAFDFSDPAAFVTELSASTRFFEAQAIAKVRIGQRIVAFKIRSIPKESLERVMLEMRPKNLPKIKNRAGELIISEESTAYRQWLLTYGYLKILEGFADITLRDREGHIVWQVPGEIRDTAAAVQTLKEMGITTHQVEDLSRQIDALSLLDAEQDLQAFFAPSGSV